MLNKNKIIAKGVALSLLAASGVLATLGASWHSAGTPTPPTLSTAKFTVAILAGPKQAAQSAPDNTESTAEAVAPAEVKTEAPPVTTKRDTSLPDAVQAAQQAAPGPEVVKPVEVLPPAKVSMPGGQLMAEDAPAGDRAPDPFALNKGEVFIRLLVNEQGKVVRFGLIRSGGDPMRDSLILKAMRSRTYDPKELRIRLEDKVWQLDLVIPYGNNDFLP